MRKLPCARNVTSRHATPCATPPCVVLHRSAPRASRRTAPHRPFQDDPEADIAAESKGVLAKSFNDDGGWAAVQAVTEASEMMNVRSRKENRGDDLSVENLEMEKLDSSTSDGMRASAVRTVTISSPSSTGTTVLPHP